MKYGNIMRAAAAVLALTASSMASQYEQHSAMESRNIAYPLHDTFSSAAFAASSSQGFINGEASEIKKIQKCELYGYYIEVTIGDRD